MTGFILVMKFGLKKIADNSLKSVFENINFYRTSNFFVHLQLVLVLEK